MKVAIIPARGGSKRIPRKNCRNFFGKPMIAWSIGAAVESGIFDHVVVSTDDDEIAAIAERCGAEVPFRRPDALSGDHVATRPVVNDAIEKLTMLYGKPSQVCCLYATAPFVRKDDLVDAYSKLMETGAEFVFSVAKYAYQIQRALRINAQGFTEMRYPEHAMTRSQDLEDSYHDAGQFYWGQTAAFLSNRSALQARSVPYVMPPGRVQDIDTPEDWEHAELLFRALNEHR
jgi:N-acylneuraminate cytidylyltransferase